jgi:hypothetical protein
MQQQINPNLRGFLQLYSLMQPEAESSAQRMPTWDKSGFSAEASM